MSIDIYNPDNWVIVKFNSKEHGSAYKVLGGWSGGYLDGDSWRLSSGLNDIEEDGEYYLMHNHSGSVYKCHKDGNGMGYLSANQYNIMKKQVEEAGAEISTITVEEFLSEKSKMEIE